MNRLSNSVPSAQTITDIIASDSGDFAATLDTLANNLGKHIQSVTTSQIRGIFSVVREIEQQTLQLDNQADLPGQVQARLTMLKPKLAYQVGRLKKEKQAPMEDLRYVLATAIDQVTRTKKVFAFRNFVNLFEAILAYHRYHGGSEKEQR
jgi:CRISPR-associated protein Csm2